MGYKSKLFYPKVFIFSIFMYFCNQKQNTNYQNS